MRKILKTNYSTLICHYNVFQPSPTPTTDSETIVEDDIQEGDDQDNNDCPLFPKESTGVAKSTKLRIKPRPKSVQKQ